MNASQRLLILSKKAALAEAELEKEAAELKEVCLETQRPPDMLYTDISECEESKLEAHFCYQNALVEIVQAATKSIADNALYITQEYRRLQEAYFVLLKWLSFQPAKDATGRETTYLNQFMDDHPYDSGIWNCYESLPSDGTGK